ncbi:MAG: hypothetical protein ACLRXQ_06090 [Phascolarctobacterium faecium]
MGSIPLALAIDIQMMPIVAAVPKEVPVKSETKQQSRKTIKMNTDGMSRPDIW